MNKVTAIAVVLLTAFSQGAIAADEQGLETGLINALRLKKNTPERIGNSGKAIQAYVKAGYLNKKPNQRADYTDYYVLKKPALLMGHTLVVIEQEYMSRYVGCCVSPGLGITVKVSGSSKNLEKFANKNGCSFSNNVAAQNELKSVGVKANFPKGHYASLSCRERDAEH